MILIEMAGNRGINNEFIIREVSFIIIDGETRRVQSAETVHFKVPYPACVLPEHTRQTNRWIETTLGVAPWEYGLVSSSRIWSVLRTYTKGHSIILTKGSEKANVLASYIPDQNIYDLDNFDCPRSDHISKSPQSCVYHQKNQNACTLTKALKYASWLISPDQDTLFDHFKTLSAW